MWARILDTMLTDSASPVVEYGLSLEEINELVVVPLKGLRDVTLNGRTILFGGIERVEIRAEGKDVSVPPLHDEFLNALSRWFESSGTDVTKEFIRDPTAWGPKIGAPDRLEAIPVDLLFDRLVTNEFLQKATHDRFRSRNYADAVEAAFKCLANAVKEKSGDLHKDGPNLMRHVFSERSPLLKFNARESQSERDEHNGYRDIFAGVMTGIRNPRAHEHEMKDSPAVALELLAMANHLMRKLESATKNDAPPEESTS